MPKSNGHPQSQRATIKVDKQPPQSNLFFQLRPQKSELKPRHWGDTFGKREHWGEGEWYIDIGERGRGWEALILQKMYAIT